MQDKYVILDCTKTIELLEWCHRETDFRPWTPTYMTKRRVGQLKPKYVDVRKPELPGLVFVPLTQWPDFWRRVPGKYRVSVMALDSLARPRTCTLADLREMEQILRDQEPGAVTGELLPGTRVVAVAGPFKGMVAQVVEHRKRNVRVQIGTKYVSMPPKLLDFV